VDFVAIGGRTASISSVRSENEGGEEEGCLCGGLVIGVAGCWRGVDVLGEAIAGVMWPRVVREVPVRRGNGKRKARVAEEWDRVFVD